MRTTWRSSFVVLAAFILLLAGCGNPTADKPAAEISEAVEIDDFAETAQGESGAEAASPGVVYAFTKNSGIDFEGYKVTGPHVGGFGKFVGSVTISDGDIEQARIKIDIDTTSIYSDNPDLTTTLLGLDFFEVETYPTSTFISTRIERFPDGSYSVTGNLDLHGITKGVTFPATIDLDGGILTAEAEFTINRFDWDLTYKGLADDLIRKDVLIIFEIEAAVEGG